MKSRTWILKDKKEKDLWTFRNQKQVNYDKKT